MFPQKREVGGERERERGRKGGRSKEGKIRKERKKKRERGKEWKRKDKGRQGSFNVQKVYTVGVTGKLL